MFLACLKKFNLKYNTKLMRLRLNYLDIHFSFPLVNLTLQFLYELVSSQYFSIFYIFQQDKPRYNILGLINVSKERVPSIYAQVIFLVFKSQLILNAFRYINTFINKLLNVNNLYINYCHQISKSMNSVLKPDYNQNFINLKNRYLIRCVKPIFYQPL